VIEAPLDIGGLPVTLLDTAGLREAPEEVEELGVALARRRATSADLRLFLIDDIGDLPALGVDAVAGDIVALAKADLRTPSEGLAVSGKSGFGLDQLLDSFAATLSERVSTGATLTRERQRLAIHRARVETSSALTRVVAGEADNVLVAEDIRRALGALDALVGKTDVEAVLDVVFASFCLGK
jgi:tRNA modification GTPase